MKKFTKASGLLCLALVSCAPAKVTPSPRPASVPTTCFVAFPADSNANPPMVFGGKLMSEMDRCAAIIVRRRLYDSPTAKDAVTVSVVNVEFVKAAQVKDLLVLSGEVTEILGPTSLAVSVVVEREERGGKRELIAEGEFVFVAYDLETHKAIEHGLK